jgi:hypothetical protein
MHSIHDPEPLDFVRIEDLGSRWSCKQAIADDGSLI